MPGTIVDAEDFDATQDCEVLHGAMKGLGTNEEAIIAIVARRSNAQRQELKTQFAQMFGRDLVDELKSELGGDFEDAILALMMPTVDYDAWCLNDAMSGAGTTESTLTEIMCSRSNDEINAIKDAYKRLYEADLAEELNGDAGGNFRNLLFSLAQAVRNEGDDVDEDAARADAQDLFDAGEATWGTDESRFNVVLASRSYAQLHHVFAEYAGIAEKEIEDAIKSEMSGDVQDAMLAVIATARHPAEYFAERLHKSMDGVGTNDQALIRVIVSRSEVDLEEIKMAFLNRYEQELEDFIKDDINGDYSRLMLAIVQGNQ